MTWQCHGTMPVTCPRHRGQRQPSRPLPGRPRQRRTASVPRLSTAKTQKPRPARVCRIAAAAAAPLAQECLVQTNSGHRYRRLDPAQSARRHQRTTRISGHRARGSGPVLIGRGLTSAATPHVTASAPGMLRRMLHGPLSGRKRHVLVANRSAIGPARGLPRPTGVIERGLTAPHGGHDAMAKRTRGPSAVASAAGGDHMAGACVCPARRCRHWSTCTASCRSACRRRRRSRWPPSPVTATSLGADQAPPRPHGQY